MKALPIKLANTYKEAHSKYGWDSGVEGFTVEWNMLTVAEISEKNVEFIVKRRRSKYLINPTRAKSIAKKWGSVYTRKKDKKVIVVIPRSECERIKL